MSETLLKCRRKNRSFLQITLSYFLKWAVVVQHHATTAPIAISDWLTKRQSSHRRFLRLK
jgi:hypothetical protein